MNWKLILKTSLIIGILAISIQLTTIYFDISLFYYPFITWDLILFIFLYAIAASLIFSFIYKQTDKFRVLQSLVTVVLGLGLSYGLTILGLIIFLKFFT